MRGSGPLYDELHALLDAEAVPTPVHRLFAALPPLLRERGVPHQLLVTTSFDLALEQAFLERGEEFDVVFYIAAGRDRGRFCHIAPDGPAQVITIPNTYTDELSLERRTIILKLHGRVDRSDGRELESFVVTEDDYIDYLAQSDVSASAAGRADGEAAAQPLPLPRLRDDRLEPSRRPEPALGRPRAQLPLVGGAAGARRPSSGSSGTGARSTCSSCRSRRTRRRSAAQVGVAEAKV